MVRASDAQKPGIVATVANSGRFTRRAASHQEVQHRVRRLGSIARPVLHKSRNVWISLLIFSSSPTSP